MIGGMVLALAAYVPGYHAIAEAVNPALVAAQARTPVVVETDPATCSIQFDPAGTRRFDSACDIAKSQLVSTGIGYQERASVDGSTRIRVGDTALEVDDGRTLDGPALKARKAEVAAALKVDLAVAGYPPGAQSETINWVRLYGWMLIFVVAACALYGPQAAALVEMFPTRIRYTAMSLPYHIGTGWVGGFLPVTSFALVAITGNIYAGTWYPIFFTALSVVCALIFMKETTGKPLDEC
jgi:hypothetical protein